MDREAELPRPGSQAGAWEPAQKLSPPHQLQQILRPDLAADFPAFQQTVGEVALLPVQRDDLLFYGAFSHQPVNRHRALLADAVGAVGGLVFHRRVPPRVHVDDIIRRREVEADAAGLEAD